jgi:hypothetical protein
MQGRCACLASAGGCGLKDARLHLAGQAGVHGQDDELWHAGAQALHAVPQDLCRRVNLLLACDTFRVKFELSVLPVAVPD